jgi:hypothetical protein
MAAGKRTRRAFGSVRKLPSGRWQASYLGPDGLRHNADVTFPSKLEADTWLATVRADVVRDMWRMPTRSGMSLDQFAERCIRQRELKESTRTRYVELWDTYISPSIGELAVEDVKPDVVRAWYSELGQSLAARTPEATPGSLPRRTGRATVANAYRVLRLVMNVAVEDGLIDTNPCRIKGGGTHKAKERPVLTVEQTEELAAKVPDRYRALVYLLCWSALRIGEATLSNEFDEPMLQREVFIFGRYPSGTPSTPTQPTSRSDLREPRIGHVLHELDVHVPVHRHLHGLLVDVVASEPGHELIEDSLPEGSDEDVVLRHGDTEDVLTIRLEHGLVPRDHQVALRMGLLDRAEDAVDRRPLGVIRVRQVLVDRRDAMRTRVPSGVEDERVRMSPTEAMVLLQVGHLLGVLAIRDLAHDIEPVGHRLPVLLLDRREVRRSIRVRGHAEMLTTRGCCGFLVSWTVTCHHMAGPRKPETVAAAAYRAGGALLGPEPGPRLPMSGPA